MATVTSTNDKLESITGKIRFIKRDMPGFQAFEMRTAQSNRTQCLSNFPMGKISVGDEIVLFGNFELSQIYGWQFKAVAKRANVPEDVSGITCYLVKNISGIGETIAKRIVNQFGCETWKIIEEEPQRLAEVKGISVTKAQKIAAEYLEKIGSREDMVWFGYHGITNSDIIRAIKEKYGENYQETIAKNPYILINDITGIGFGKADKIAATFGFKENSQFRIAAGIKYTLESAQNTGNVYLTHETLTKVAYKLLNSEQIKNHLPVVVNHADIRNVLDQLLESDERKKRTNPICFIDLIDDNGAIYEKSMYKEECNVARLLKDIVHSTTIDTIYCDDMYRAIDDIVEKKYGGEISLDNSQKDAVIVSVKNPVSVITGGPGTGKTTTLNTIISLLKAAYLYNDDDFALLAPTGKAAKRMSEQTGLPAMTIHRATGWPRFEQKNITAKNIIVDEMSMADMHIVYALLKAIQNVNHLIFVGDVDQLPSVGCGNVLKDIINSGIVPISKLNVIHRQAEESGIIKYSHRIIEEHMFPENSDKEDFTYVNTNDIEGMEKQVIDKYMKYFPEYLKERGLDPTSVQILCPLGKKEWKMSASYLNDKIQALYATSTTPKLTFFSNTFYVGDKVMHIKNDYKLVRQSIKNDSTSEGVMNGETGIVVDADDKAKILTVQYGDDIVAYTKDNISELMLAYALTIHKSQGSEYQAVIIPIPYGGMPSIMNKNLLYTAVTRAKSQVFIIGDKGVINVMVHTKFSEKRNTKLAERLQG